MSVTGSLEIQVNVWCPECGEHINLLDDEGLKADGWIYDLVMPSDGTPWSDACKDFSKEHLDTFGEDYKCSKCDKTIYIKEIQY